MEPMAEWPVVVHEFPADPGCPGRKSAN